MLRIFIATAIISLGISSAAYFIMQKPLILVPSLNNHSPQKQIGNNPVQNLFVSANPNQPMVENWSPKSSEEPKSDSNQNLTGQFVQNLAQVLIDNNPDGPKIVDGKLEFEITDPEKTGGQLAAQAEAYFAAQSPWPIIQNSDLKISSDNSKKALIDYFIAFKKITENSGLMMSAISLYNPGNDWLSTVNQMINVYQKNIDGFYDLTVPNSALEIHKKEIQLLSAKKALLEKIINYQKDPLIALLAINQLNGLDIQFENLKKEALEFVKNNNLGI